VSPPRRIPDEEGTAACVARGAGTARHLSAIRPVLRRGLSRLDSAAYLGISPSKFDQLRKANRIAPPKVLDGRLIFTVEKLDEFLDALPDETQTSNDEWTASL
jgi:hypothetical protein